MYPFDFDIFEIPAPKMPRREPVVLSIFPAGLKKHQKPARKMVSTTSPKNLDSLLEPLPKFPHKMQPRNPPFEENRLKKLDSSDLKQWGFSLDVFRGYNPDNIKVKLEGQKLVIRGYQEYESPDGTQKESRSFQRTLAIPENVTLNSLKVEMTEKGQLIVRGEKELPPPPEQQQREIPIEVLKTDNSEETKEVKDRTQKKT